MTIDIFNLSTAFEGETEERECKTCFICGCLFAHDSELCSSDCEDEFNKQKQFEEDMHYPSDYDEEQNF